MLSKCHILFIFLTFGFVLNPKASYGCGTRQCKSGYFVVIMENIVERLKKFAAKNNQNEKDKKDGCGGTRGHRSAVALQHKLLL